MQSFKWWLLVVLYGIVIVAIDLVWSFLNKGMYAKLAYRVRGGGGGGSSPPLKVIVIAYLFVVAAAYAFVVPAAMRASTIWSAMVQGAIAGLIIYGIYNATNTVLFWPAYSQKIANIDTLWGACLFTFAGALAFVMLGARSPP